MSDTLRTRFTGNDDAHIAYQVVGDGPLDLLLVDSWVHHVEAVWDFPDFARLLRRLSSFGRLIHFDRRGTGLSDPVPLERLPDLETQVEDAVSVLDAAGSSEAIILGINDGALIASLLAAAHPERCRSLVLFPAVVKHSRAGGMPMELTREAARLIPKAKLVELPGSDHLAYSEGIDEVLDEIEEFISGARSGGESERFLATLLFTDIVGSTSKAAEIGDRRWRDLLDEHHKLVRMELLRFKGRELDTAGDGFFATFAGPGVAIRCAMEIIRAAPRLGLGIRTGIHT